MENASKALLIAAAILIVIILVAFGVKVLNSTSGSKDSASTVGESISVAAFNNKIKIYAGANKSQEEVLKLLQIVKSHNEKSAWKIGVEKVYPANIDEMKRKNEQLIPNRIDSMARQIEQQYKTVNVYIYYGSDGYVGIIGLQFGDTDKYKADYNNKIVEDK